MHEDVRPRDRSETLTSTGTGLIFAGGCPRSGLTLLRRLLAQHPGVLAGSDTAIAPSVAFQWRNFAQSLGTLHQEFFDLEPEAVSGIMGRFLEGSLRAENERRIIFEKTSINVAAFEALADMLPGVKFVHVVRDGRDFAASLLARDWRDPATGHPFAHVSDPKAAIEYWSALVASGLAAEQKLEGTGRLLRVRYEDLVRETDTWLAVIMAFIGADWPCSDIQPPLADSDYRGMERDSLPFLLAPVSDARVGRHNADLPPAVLARLEEFGAPALKALGYI